MNVPFDRILCIDSPMPPANLEMDAQSFRVSKMPSIESSFTVSRKQLLICGLLVPALNSVGVACVMRPSESASYVATTSDSISSNSASVGSSNVSSPSRVVPNALKRRIASSPWIPSATRRYMYCGRSTMRLPSVVSTFIR